MLSSHSFCFLPDPGTSLCGFEWHDVPPSLGEGEQQNFSRALTTLSLLSHLYELNPGVIKTRGGGGIRAKLRKVWVLKP